MKRIIFIIVLLVITILPVKVFANCICNDGTTSPSCTYNHRGCCSHHGGVSYCPSDSYETTRQTTKRTTTSTTMTTTTSTTMPTTTTTTTSSYKPVPVKIDEKEEDNSDSGVSGATGVAVLTGLGMLIYQKRRKNN